MTRVFEIKIKSGREIYLSDERWKHLVNEHPEIAEYFEELKEVIEKFEIIRNTQTSLREL